MEASPRSPSEIARPLADRFLNQFARASRPVFVALDGHSGVGKSTVAAATADLIASTTAATVTIIEGDEFYSGGSARTWDARTASEKASTVVDWRRQRAVLDQLARTGRASWLPFDWWADDWDAEPAPLVAEHRRVVAGEVVLLEGAYSARPELHDLLDLRVLLTAPADVRRRQLLAREGDDHRAEWEARWAEAEYYYFVEIMPPQRFDLVLGPG